jgi:hypothetical protein
MNMRVSKNRVNINYGTHIFVFQFLNESVFLSATRSHIFLASPALEHFATLHLMHRIAAMSYSSSFVAAWHIYQQLKSAHLNEFRYVNARER